MKNELIYKFDKEFIEKELSADTNYNDDSIWYIVINNKEEYNKVIKACINLYPDVKFKQRNTKGEVELFSEEAYVELNEILFDFKVLLNNSKAGLGIRLEKGIITIGIAGEDLANKIINIGNLIFE